MNPHFGVPLLMELILRTGAQACHLYRSSVKGQSTVISVLLGVFEGLASLSAALWGQSGERLTIKTDSGRPKTASSGVPSSPLCLVGLGEVH